MSHHTKILWTQKIQLQDKAASLKAALLSLKKQASIDSQNRELTPTGHNVSYQAGIQKDSQYLKQGRQAGNSQKGS